MLYNGQLDVLIAAPLTENFLLQLDWDGAAAYRQADRHVWKIKSTDTEVAGFVRQVNDFTQVRTNNHSPILQLLHCISTYMIYTCMHAHTHAHARARTHTHTDIHTHTH